MAETVGVLVTDELSEASNHDNVPPAQPVAESVTVAEVQTIEGVADTFVGADGTAFTVTEVVAVEVQLAFVTLNV